MKVVCDDCNAGFEWKLMKEAQKEKLGEPTNWAECPQGEKAYETSKKEEELIKLQNKQREMADVLDKDGGLVSTKLNNEIMSEYNDNLEQIKNKREELDDRLTVGKFA